MKTLTTLITIIFISLLSSPSWSETVDDLVVRNDIFYKKFTDDPFTGKITGGWNGKIKNGKREGSWKEYFENGQLWRKGIYKDGQMNGLFEFYYQNLNSGLRREGIFKKDLENGLHKSYYQNGKLWWKGTYKDGKREGLWEHFNEDGTTLRTETWIDDVKQ